MIIDTHVHIGEERKFDVYCPPEKLLPIMDQNNIDISIVQPQCGSPSLIEDHRLIAKMAKENCGRIYGMAVFDPVGQANELEDLANWAINKLGFVALKLHTYGFSVSPLNKYGQRIFEVAHKLKVPVMVHTGKGVPQALPALLIPIAKKYPDLPIIISHGGGYIYFQEAIVVAHECPNTYIETSWVTAPNLKTFVKEIGSNRVMFGSDSYDNVSASLCTYRSLGFDDETLEACLGGTAEKVFKLR